jgi:hypothetical protein
MGAQNTSLQTYLQLLDTCQATSEITSMIKGFADGVGEMSPALDRLQKNAKKPWPDGGGSSISWRVRNKIGSGTEYIAGMPYKANAAPNNMTLLTLPRMYYRYEISWFKTQLQENQGSRFGNFVAEQLDIGRKDAGMDFGLKLLGNGTTDLSGATMSTVAPTLYGLGFHVESTPTSSSTNYCGVTRSSSTGYINNQYYSLGSIGSLSSAVIESTIAMCSHNGKTPDLGICSDVTFSQLWLLAKTEKWPQISDRVLQKAYDLGYPRAIQFGDCMIVPDKIMTDTSHSGPYLSSEPGILWLLTTSSFDLNVDEDWDLGPLMTSTLFDGFQQNIYWSGQLTCNSPRNNAMIHWS